jgi:ABC-type nitrate/sulfonate/bicarbonate transport system permease component
VALWAAVVQSGVFPRVFLPGPVEVIQKFGTLMANGILPAYLEDSVVRLAAGTAVGLAIGIPLGLLVGLSDRAYRVLWPVLLFFQAIGDIAWLPILLIWFGFGLTTMIFVIVYTVLFPVVPQHRARRSLGAARAAPRGAVARRVEGARAVGSRAAGRLAQHHDRACATAWASAGAR